jgi:hypothetical protein
MPTKVAATEQSDVRRGMRLALGVTLAFALTQIFAWTLAFVTPVFAALLLQEPRPMPVRQALLTFGWALAGMGAGLAIGLILSPYPGLAVVVFSVVIYKYYVLAMTSGAHILAIVGALIGVFLMPVMAQTFPELPLTIFASMAFNIAVAILCSWMMFSILPVPDAPVESPAAKTKKSFDQIASAAGMTTAVAAPLLIAFLFFGWSKVLVLIMAALFATGMSAEGGSKAGMTSVVANLFYGVPFAIIAYELIVMAPGLGFAVLLVFAICLLYAERITSGGPSAALWKSGLNGFLILLGSSIGFFAPDADDNALDRVFQIAIACAYVIAAYSFIDLVRSAWRAKLVMQVRQSLSLLSPRKIKLRLRKAQGTG